MAESMQGLHRSHRCTEVSNKNIGETVTVMGWVQKRRNLGSLIFIDLRDRSGLLQLVFDENDGEVFEKAKKPAYQLTLDFGKEIGIKHSSAQITNCYKPTDLLGKQILAVVNFAPKQIANFISEVLVLGTYSKQGVILITPDQKVENGDKLG